MELPRSEKVEMVEREIARLYPGGRLVARLKDGQTVVPEVACAQPEANTEQWIVYDRSGERVAWSKTLRCLDLSERTRPDLRMVRDSAKFLFGDWVELVREEKPPAPYPRWVVCPAADQAAVLVEAPTLADMAATLYELRHGIWALLASALGAKPAKPPGGGAPPLVAEERRFRVPEPERFSMKFEGVEVDLLDGIEVRVRGALGDGVRVRLSPPGAHALGCVLLRAAERYSEPLPPPRAP